MLLAATAGICALSVFLFWELLEHWFRPADSLDRGIHFVRGISSSLVAASVIAWLSHRQSLRRVGELEDEVRERTRDLAKTRSFLQLVVDTTPASLLVLDKHFKVVSANKTAKRVHRAELEGRHCFEILADRSERCVECGLEKLFIPGASGEVLGEHRDPKTGEALRVEGHRLEFPAGEAKLLLVEQVVTEQKKLEARLIHNEKMAALGLLAAGVAHEIGNPLSSVSTQLQLLEHESLPGDAGEIVTTVRQELARLRRTVRELTNFSRRRRPERSLISVQAVVRDALRLLKHDKRMKLVKVVEKFDPETPPVEMVEDHLVQVVINFLINAVQAMPDGGTLEIGLRPSGDQVELTIQDSGGGMESRVLDACFDPFFTTREHQNGTGLGMSISKDIIQAAGGEIELQSTPGQGTTVLVTLPEATMLSAREETSVPGQEVA